MIDPKCAYKHNRNKFYLCGFIVIRVHSYNAVSNPKSVMHIIEVLINSGCDANYIKKK